VGLLMLAACHSPNPEQVQTPAPSNPPAGSAPGSPAPGASQPSGNPPAATAPPPKASAPHGPDDSPIVLSDGSMWIGLTPQAGNQAAREKSFNFTSFEPGPGYSQGEVRSIMLRDNYDTRLVWDGIDINGTPPGTCQNPGEDCLIQI